MRNLGRSAIQIPHRLQDAPRQSVREPEPRKHREHPDQNNIPPQHRDMLTRALERPQNAQLADRLSLHVQQWRTQHREFSPAGRDPLQASARRTAYSESARSPPRSPWTPPPPARQKAEIAAAG